MIIKFGKDASAAYGNWAEYKNIHISQPYFKIVADSGLGFYILNSYKFFFFPKFNYTFHGSFWELSVNFAGWIFEIMWSRAFKV